MGGWQGCFKEFPEGDALGKSQGAALIFSVMALLKCIDGSVLAFPKCIDGSVLALLKCMDGSVLANLRFPLIFFQQTGNSVDH